ncbi:MAG: HDOD domain-containing protein [Deltaproteobacteria bacterium]|nr:MAG: HDOD domain-containing protein [Deltaproteobacteria bacterium]
MRKIIFVDDEQRVLDAFKRSLHVYRDQWEMYFESSAEAALKFLESNTVDVIISDIRMPEMDGVTLLKKVQEKHPGIVRIILSGFTEMEAALQSVPVAHQFLNKPCEAQKVKEIIERAFHLQNVLNNQTIKDVVGKIDQLPVLPTVYKELITALGDPDVSVKSVAGIVEKDIALGTKILQVVNSAFFGLPRTVTSVFSAVTLLGLNMTKNLSLTLKVFQNFEEDAKKLGFSISNFQSHCIQTGQIAKTLLTAKHESEAAFLAGTFHDLGKLILATKLPEIFKNIMTQLQDPDDDSCEIEEKLMGVSHAEIGAYLLGIWGLPNPIVEAVANHHKPSRVPHSDMDIMGAVHVANYLAYVKDKKMDKAVKLLDSQFLLDLQLGEKITQWGQKILIEDLQ